MLTSPVPRSARPPGSAPSLVIGTLAAVLACAFGPAAQSRAKAGAEDLAESAAALIRMRVSEGHQPRLRGPGFAENRMEMEALYAPEDYRPLWSDNGAPCPDAGEAIAILRQAEAHGLPVVESDLAYLEEGWRRLGSGALTNPAEIGDLDAATSLLLIRHVARLHNGGIPPGTLFRGLGMAPKKYDVAAAIRRGLEEGCLVRMVEEAEPQLPQYVALKSALERYRVLARTSPLPSLPATAKVRPGSWYAGVADLERLLRLLGDLGKDGGPGLSASPSREAPVWGDSVTTPPAGGFYAGELVNGVRRFQERHGLNPDGVIGRATFKQLNQPLSRRVRQIELALERLRWLPALDNAPVVVVNIPAFHLYVFDSFTPDARPALQMKVVVGKAGPTGTPVLADRIRYVVFSPFWHPPRSIIKDEIVPAIARDSTYLAAHDMELVAGTSDESTALAATPENLESLRAGRAWVRQRPGSRNSLGLVKFVLPNSYDIYLHDTPSRSLFARERRDFSHGCIRVQDPVALAELLLRDQPEWTRDRIDRAMRAGRARRVDLTVPVPIYILYATAAAGPDGSVFFYDDLYGHDEELDRLLRSVELRER